MIFLGELDNCTVFFWLGLCFISRERNFVYERMRNGKEHEMMIFANLVLIADERF